MSGVVSYNFDAAPAINADGSIIAYEGHAGGYPPSTPRSTEIVLFTFSPEWIHVGITNAPAQFLSGATISGDGTSIAFESLVGYRDIVSLDTATGGFTQATHATWPRYYPYSDNASANRDGTRIAYDSYRDPAGKNADGNREIFVFDAAAGGVIQMTETVGGESLAASISMDGTKVAFESTANPTGNNVDGNREIFLYDATTTTLTQVTQTFGSSTFNLGASISGNGNSIAFESTADLTAQNADGNREIFLFDAASGAFTQVTDTLDGSSSGASINGDGAQIAFDSYGDLTGSNVDRNREVFLFDVASGAFTQVTDTTRRASSGASLSGDATKVAFASTADLAGGNADANREIFLFDVATSDIMQVTVTTNQDNFRPSINCDGTKVAFDSRSYEFEGLFNHNSYDQVFLFDVTTGEFTPVTNADDAYTIFGNGYQPSISGDGAKVAYTSGAEIFSVHFGGGATSSSIHVFDTDTASDTPLPAGPSPSAGSNSRNPATSDDGAKIAFDSNGNLTGNNADGNVEIFTFDAAASSLTQVTHTIGGASQLPAISGDGTTIAFQSTADLTGSNADGNPEIFLFDAGTDSFFQVTDATAGSSLNASIDGDGTRIAFTSSADLTGMNADGNAEVFVFDAMTRGFIQVTHTIGTANQSPSISGDGARIAFLSDANLTGHNADGNAEIFVFDVGANSFAQITDMAGQTNSNPSVSGDGSTIAFYSTADLTRENADGNGEVYGFDADKNQFTQVTATMGGAVSSSAISINGDGTRIVLQQGNDIYVATIDYAGTSVEGVHLFYDKSAYDGYGFGVTEEDFGAIATDKSPLLPGETAAFANVSAYDLGINGLFIDVGSLPNDGAGIDASDFKFTVGNDDFPDVWAGAPAPSYVGVFPNAGAGGADRIYVTFVDGAIVDTWLGITVLATRDTGLDDPATFFYGSVPGDTGAARIGQGQFFGRDAADLQSIAVDWLQAADIANPNDVNRDGVVNEYDLQVTSVFVGQTVTQLTEHTDHTIWHHTTSLNGAKVAFTSYKDLTGKNADHNEEVFLLDTATGSIRQVTDTTDASNRDPSLNSDGTKIAFASNSDLTGGNADGNYEIVLFDIVAATFTQLTDTSGSVGSWPYNNEAPSINGDGTKIAFNSVGVIRLFDANTGGFTSVGPGYLPSISSDGTRIAFHSNSNETGNNPDGNLEIFLFDTSTNNLTQVTDATGELLPYPFEGLSRNSSSPVISSNGTTVVFVSEANLTGNNPETSINPEDNVEVFVFDVDAASLTQVTDGGGGAPSINGDGTKIAFWSTFDPTGRNVDRNVEVFLFDTTTNRFTQVTDTSRSSGFTFIYGTSLSGDGTRITFESDADLTGQNADGNREIYLATLGDPANGASRIAPNVIAVIAPQAEEVPGDYDASGQTEQGDLDLVLLNWGADAAGLPPDWINERPAAGIVGQAALDRVLLNWGAAAPAAFVEDNLASAEVQVMPNGRGLGGPEGPFDERIGAEKIANRELAFAAFAVDETQVSIFDGLFSALMAGKLVL